MQLLEQSLTGRCLKLAVTRERHRRERLTAALARAIVWLLPHQRRAPLRPAPAAGGRPAAACRQALPGNPAGQRRRLPASLRRLVFRRTSGDRQASGGRPAGPRRLAVPGGPARPSGVSRDRGTDRRRSVVATVTTVIDVAGVTVAIVAAAGPH